MNQLRSAWDSVLGQYLSLRRIAGFSLFWLWMLMMFYSIAPYGFASDVRAALYMSLFVSLAAMVVTMLFLAVIGKRGVRLIDNGVILMGSAIAMAAGSMLTPITDPNTTLGMLALGMGSIMTGAGSAVLFMCWVELMAETGGRLALVEFAVASCAAFAVGLFLALMISVITVVVVVVAPVVSAIILRRCSKETPETTLAPKQALSKQSLVLFGKALVGAAFIGGIEGFFDVVSGFKTFQVQDAYGLYLFLAGFMAMLLVALLAVFAHRDSVFFSYRLAMLLICLGCLSTPFLGDNTTYLSAFIFAGYHSFVLVLCVICIDVAISFRVSIVRAASLGFVALYGGETLGSLLGHAMSTFSIMPLDFTFVTLVTVSLLFISHLCLFTEMDLLKIGIGEVSVFFDVPDPNEQEGQAARAEDMLSGDPSVVLAERYGLSPRESDVLPLLLEGRTIARIQETLFISAGTVSTHIRHIYQKTGVSNRQELIDLAHDITCTDAEKDAS